MRLWFERLLPLDLHGVMHERRKRRCHGSWAVLDEQGRRAVGRQAFVFGGIAGSF